MSQMEIDGEGPQKILVAFDRESVVNQNLTSFLELLVGMTKTPDLIRAHEDSIHMVFMDWDDDSREVYEIPEIRAFVRALHQAFPWWFHFANKEDQTIFNVMCCLMDDVTVEHRVGGKIGVRVNPKSFGRTAFLLFTAMNDLYDERGMTDDENYAMSERVNKYLAKF